MNPNPTSKYSIIVTIRFACTFHVRFFVRHETIPSSGPGSGIGSSNAEEFRRCFVALVPECRGFGSELQVTFSVLRFEPMNYQSQFLTFDLFGLPAGSIRSVEGPDLPLERQALYGMDFGPDFPEMLINVPSVV
jgi:hypothetical protein